MIDDLFVCILLLNHIEAFATLQLCVVQAVSLQCFNSFHSPFPVSIVHKEMKTILNLSKSQGFLTLFIALFSVSIVYIKRYENIFFCPQLLEQEARHCQLESKYLILLSEMNKPRSGSSFSSMVDDGEVVVQKTNEPVVRSADIVKQLIEDALSDSSAPNIRKG